MALTPLQIFEGVLQAPQMEDLHSIMASDDAGYAAVEKTKRILKEQIGELSEELKPLKQTNDRLKMQLILSGLLINPRLVREVTDLQKEMFDLMKELEAAKKELAAQTATNAPLESWHSYWDGAISSSKQRIWGGHLRAQAEQNAPRGNEH